MSTISITQWRIYCNTEGVSVLNWSVAPPTTCINNTAHSINLNSVQPVQLIDTTMTTVTNFYQDPLEASRVVQQTPIIDLKSFYGISSDNVVSTTGTGAATATSETDAEIKLSISGTTDSCNIRSAERGYYIAGLSSECGMAVRIPSALDTSHILKWGYFDDSNGYYFKLVGSDLNVGIMNNGSEILISRSNFNKNKLDGSGASGITLDLSKGNIFRISFTWYGFGQVIFGVVQTSSTNTQSVIPLHIFTTSGQTSCGNPNLPINMKLSSNGSSVSKSVYLAGRQYSILGKVSPNVYNAMYFINNAASTSTSINQLFSLKKKSTFITAPVYLKYIRAISSVNAKILIIKNATLTGASFQDTSLVDESSVSVDTAATISGGTICKTYLIFSGQLADIDMNFHVYETDTITIAWQTFSNSGTLSLHLDWTERR